MKKGITFLVLLLFLSLFVDAQADAPGLDDAPLVGEIRSGNEFVQDLSQQDISDQYLAKEWTTFLRDHKYGKHIYKLNPVFKFLFGMEFEISWRFVAGMLLWVIMISFLHPTFKMFVKSTIPSLIAAIAFSAIAANLLNPKILDALGKVIKNIWHNLLMIIALIVIIIFVSYFMKELTKWWKKKRTEKKLDKAEAVADAKTPELSGVKETIEKAEGMKKGYDEEFQHGGGI